MHIAVASPKNGIVLISTANEHDAMAKKNPGRMPGFSYGLIKHDSCLASQPWCLNVLLLFSVPEYPVPV